VAKETAAPEFHDVRFDGADLLDRIGDARGEVHFVGCSFVGTMADDIDLTGSRFEDCDLSNAKFDDSDLVRTTWIACRGENPSFVKVDLTDATFERCELTGAAFTKSDLAGSTWTGCKLMAANFRERSGLGWTLSDTVLMYADLHGATLDGRTLKGLDLTEADLTDADFSRSVFEECKLSRASWRNARFESADLRGADLGPLETLEQIAALKGAVLNEHQAKAIVNALGIRVVPSAEDA
jgi:fluoroquinolone resistance protein